LTDLNVPPHRYHAIFYKQFNLFIF